MEAQQEEAAVSGKEPAWTGGENTNSLTKLSVSSHSGRLLNFKDIYCYFYVRECFVYLHSLHAWYLQKLG